MQFNRSDLAGLLTYAPKVRHQRPAASRGQEWAACVPCLLHRSCLPPSHLPFQPTICLPPALPILTAPFTA